MTHDTQRVVIVGGGTAGWMTAIALSSLLPKDQVSVTLVESEQISSVGVGEATIPEISLFNDLVGINEHEFLSYCQGTYKLGIEFINWGKQGHRYMHAFSAAGFPLDNLQFYHHWQRLYQENNAFDINDFSICAQAAKFNKFLPPSENLQSPLSNLRYAYHFDASLYAQFLSERAIARGVERKEGLVTDVHLVEQSGNIKAVVLDNGEPIAGDLFIDCSGFKALLIEGALKVGFDDWSHLLRCNNAVTVATESLEELRPYTRSIAQKFGWQWQIPLQHRTGNGHVYCDQYISEDEATQTLLNTVEGKTIATPKNIKFTTGKRKKFWHKNCVAIGLSCGFLEPLESTSIHLIQESIFKLLDLFPAQSIAKYGVNQVEVDQFNQLFSDKFTAIRDFILLHYYVNQREDSEFWRYCQSMDVPISLKHKISLYESGGRIYREPHDLFTEDGWLSVMHGQGIRAKNCHPLVRNRPIDVVQNQLSSIKHVISQTVKQMPTQQQYITKYCAS